MRVGGAYIFLYSAKWSNGDEKSQKKKKNVEINSIYVVCHSVYKWKRMKKIAFFCIHTVKNTDETTKNHTWNWKKTYTSWWKFTEAYRAAIAKGNAWVGWFTCCTDIWRVLNVLNYKYPFVRLELSLFLFQCKEVLACGSFIDWHSDSATSDGMTCMILFFFFKWE